MAKPRGIGKRLKEAREAAGLTQRSAAERAGVHYVSINRWEGGRSIGTDDLAKLAYAYGVSVADLVGDGDSGAANRANDSAPAGDEPTGASGIPEELRSQPAYWRGRQDELVGMMEHIGRMMRQATDMHDRALVSQREIIAHTTPAPREILPAKPGGGAPAARPGKTAAKRRRSTG